MTALALMGLGIPELLIILAVVLLLFGGSRLAGLGKSTGRAIREFKEETKTSDADQSTPMPPPPALGSSQPPAAAATEWQQQPPASTPVEPSESDVRRDA